ncbi:uncharacterized protein LOC144453354 [Glandiceps talaboti]
MSKRLQLYLVTASNRNISVYRFAKTSMAEGVGRPNKPSKTSNVGPSAYDKVIRRHRNNEQVLQFMKFIREQETQPVGVNSIQQMKYLQKPAPLPSIRSNYRNAQRNETRSPDSEESGYNGMNDSDSDSELEMYNRTIPSPPRSYSPDTMMTNHVIGKVAKSNSYRHSYHGCPVPSESKMRGGTKQNGRNVANSMNQLPPIDRAGLPSRPSAPAPSFTPPLPDALDYFVPEEPIDYIDPE